MDNYNVGIGRTLKVLLAGGVALLAIAAGGVLAFKNSSGVTDAALVRVAAKQLALSDGVYNVAVFGGGSVSAFHVDGAAGENITLRAQDADSGDQDGGNIILYAGASSGTGMRGTVQCPSEGTDSTAVGAYSYAGGAASAAFGFYAYATGQDGLAVGEAASVNSGDYGTAIGSSTVAEGDYASAFGAFAAARVTKTHNLAGLDTAQHDAWNQYTQFDELLSFSARPNVVHGREIDLLATSTVTLTLPAGVHAYVEEVGLICSTLSLDGGALTTQPTVSFGVTGDNDKHRAAEAMTLLTAAYKRERFTTLLTDDGETSLTMEITSAGVITDGTAPAYKARPYWVIRVVEDE